MSIQSLVGRLVIKTKGEVTIEGELVEQKGNSLVIRCRKPRSSKTFLRYFQLPSLEYVSIDGNDVTVSYVGETLDEFEGVILDRIDDGVFVGANAEGGFLMARDWEFYPNDAEETSSTVADKKEKEKEKEKAKPVVQEPSAEEDDFSDPVPPVKAKKEKEKADVKAATPAKKEKAVTPVVDPEDDDFDSVPPAKPPVIGDHEEDDFSDPVPPAKTKKEKEKVVTPTPEDMDDDFDSVPTPKKNEVKAAPVKAAKPKPAPVPEPEPEEEEETPKKVGFEVGQTINFTYDGEDYESGTVVKIADPVASIRIGGKTYRFVIEEMEDVSLVEPQTDDWE